jgi:hypothetical protein
VFEKRIAIPDKIWYEVEVVNGNTEGLELKNIPDAEGGTKDVYFTGTENAENRKPDGLIIGEDYKLASSYSVGEANVPQNPLVPVFTREHYKSADWKDISGKTVTPDANYKFEGDTQLYQQWEANTFKVMFNLNGKNGTAPDSLTGVDEALSAAGGLAKAGKNLPTITGTATASESEDMITYEFVNWADRREGGNVINASSPLFPKSATDINNSEVTLYAQWRAKDAAQYVFVESGIVHDCIVPVAGVYKIEAWGAGGDGKPGNDTPELWTGGQGGYIGGNIELTAGQKLYIYVGGQGQTNNGQSKSQRSGGWNGGGKSGIGSGGSSGGGGHGASDVRTEIGDWDNSTSLASRIIVAGGGGGGAGGSFYTGHSGNGGIGIAAGGDGVNNTGDATAAGGSFAKVSDATSGDIGKGGAGASSVRGGGGGGGGYYGGAGGWEIPSNITTSNCYPGGGGGGSSWAQTEGSGLKFIESTITPPEMGGGGNTGNGKVVITFVSVTTS